MTKEMQEKALEEVRQAIEEAIKAGDKRVSVYGKRYTYYLNHAFKDGTTSWYRYHPVSPLTKASSFDGIFRIDDVIKSFKRSISGKTYVCGYQVFGENGCEKQNHWEKW